MSWVATGVAGVSLYASYQSSQAANRSSRIASEASREQLAFEQQRYDDWTEIYGPIQKNLAEYYEGVTPEYYAATGLENFQKEYQTSLQRLDESFVQKGISLDSGLVTSIKARAELDAAETRAGIRRDAPRQAAEDKSRFLQIGMGGDPSSSISSALSDRARSTSEQSLAATDQATRSIQATIPTIGRAIDEYTGD